MSISFYLKYKLFYFHIGLKLFNIIKLLFKKLFATVYTFLLSVVR